MQFKIHPDDGGSLARDFGLIAEAIADTVRGLAMPTRMYGRGSKPGNCDCAQ